jgi:sortase A
MRFHHKKGVKNHKSKSFLSVILLIVAMAGLVGGGYLLLLVMTPNLPALYPVEPVQINKLEISKSDRVYIPKIGVNVELVTGGPEALDKGSWHRFPERGDPIQGGNFIVSAHRFSIGLTPGQTRQKSPFYHIDKLEIDDQIIVDFKGKRYGYQITEHTSVKPNQIEIEAVSESPKLTLYTCTLKGESDGREVYVAKPLGEVKNGMVETAFSASYE